MKNKTTTAALLSILAIAGLAVTDAYAQSNTERLQNIDEATADILEDTEGIAGSFTALTEMLTTLQTSLTASLAEVMSAITGVQDAVNGVNDKLSNMETAVYNTESSVGSVETTVTGMSAEVSAISSKIMGVDTLVQDVATIDDRLNSIDGSLMMLENTVRSMDGDNTSDTLAVLSATVISNNEQLREVLQRLANLENGQRQLGADVEGIAAAPSRPGNILLEGESELNVDSYDYKNYGDATTNTLGKYYELDLTFSCSTDVFLASVSLVHDGDPSTRDPNEYAKYFGLTDLQDRATENRDTTHNFITVDNRDLFDTQFKFTSGGTAQTYDLPATFNNKLLEAGETLKFESQVFDRATNILYTKDGFVDNIPTSGDSALRMIADSNRTHSLPFFEINVDWLTYESNTTCSIGFGASGVTSPGLTKSNTLTYGVQTNPAHNDRSLKDFANTIDCGGEPVEITGITVDTSDDWKLAGFVNVKLEYGSEEHTLEFDPDTSNAVITNDDEFLPIYLGNQELTISGSIPLDNLLVSLTFNSQPGTECDAENGY